MRVGKQLAAEQKRHPQRFGTAHKQRGGRNQGARYDQQRHKQNARPAGSVVIGFSQPHSQTEKDGNQHRDRCSICGQTGQKQRQQQNKRQKARRKQNRHAPLKAPLNRGDIQHKRQLMLHRGVRNRKYQNAAQYPRQKHG